MDKEAIRSLFLQQIEADLALLTQSANAAREAAIHTESKAEDQYDTRGLEASYLAGAQSVRASETHALIAQYRHLDFKAFGPETPISATALIELQGDGKTLYCLLMPKGGGRSVSYEGKTIQVTTPQSPLGEVLMGRKVGDEIEVRTQTVKDYEITAVW
ncbi:GreA/GreB family elongation factor [bacterium]|nr:GreA/GreB family elongation factor [bacterium]